MACVRTFVTLRVFSEFTGIDEIGLALGLEPTMARARNPIASRVAERKYSMWKFSSKNNVGNVDSADSQDHIDWLLGKLSGRAIALTQLRNRGCLTDVSCFLELDGQGGPSLSSDQMRSLSDLGLDVTWDIYNVNVVGDKEARESEIRGLDEEH